MTNGTTAPPSSITGDSYAYPGGAPLAIGIPYMLSSPAYGDLPGYWSYRRDVALAATIHREDMWAGALSKVATKFAAHSYTIKDSKDSTLRVKNSQTLLQGADGGQGWVLFAEKVIQDLATTDNGIFIRIRHADDEAQTIKLKASFPAGQTEQTFDEAQIITSNRSAKITGIYHLDSLRCLRTGNLAYPVRYLPVYGAPQLLRWDQVLIYADQPSPRAELFGVGFCAASRAYKTIMTVAALRQMLYEFMAGKGANKLSLVSGLSPTTLEGIVKSGEQSAQAKGLLYYLGTILGALPTDAPLSLIEIILKSIPQGFDPKQIIDDSYLIYANNLGVPVQDIQPLSGQGMGTGTQSLVLAEASMGAGMLPAFLKWWEQTFSNRVLPATTELAFDNEHDVRDQQAKAQARQLRGSDRAARIASGEITPAIARQLAADDGDLPQELLADDATPGGQISDDEKPDAQSNRNPAATALIGGEPTAAPSAAPAVAPAFRSKDDTLYAEELRIARRLAEWAE